MAQMPVEGRPAWAEMGPPMGTEPESQRFDFLAMAWRRKWLIAFGLMVGLGLGFLAYKQQTPIYTSVAKVMITPKNPATVIIPGFEGMPSGPGVKQDHEHDAVLTSTTFIRDSVVSNPELDQQVPSIAGLSPEMKLFQIQEGLEVDLEKDSENLYLVSFSSPNQEDCDRVLWGVLNGYQEYLNRKYKATGQELKGILDDLKRNYDAKAEELQAKIQEQVEAHGEKLAFWNAEGIINLEQQRMQELDAHIRQLELQKTEYQSQLDRIAQLEEEGKTQAVIVFILEQHEKIKEDKEKNSEETDILELRLNLERLLFKFGEDHPEVKIVRNEIRAWEELMISRGISLPGTGDNRADFVALYKISLTEQVRSIDYELVAFRAQFEEHRARAMELNQVDLSLKNLLDQKKYQESVITSVVDRLQQVDVTGDKEGFNYEILEPPTFAEQTEPSLLKVFAVAGFLGLLGGVGIAYLVDLADKTFRSPDDIAQSLALPILGHIPFIPKSKQKQTEGITFDGTAISVHQPKSKISEAYRAVRTALFFSNRQRDIKVIQVTSPSPGDGKSTLALNLAVSIAQSGQKVLLVDADLRRPRQHKVVGENAEHGFAAVLRGDLAVAEAAIETQVPGLYFIPCGERPSNPAELLTSPKLPEFIEIARQQYDYVIIDSPPLLAVTDPSVIAPRVDAVVLTFRLRKNIKLTSDRARDILASVGAEILGVVVNGIGGQAGYGDYKYSKYGRNYAYNYRYGSYGNYGQPYGYGYGYGYGYDYEEADKYYDEPVAPGGKRRKRSAAIGNDGPKS